MIDCTFLNTQQQLFSCFFFRQHLFSCCLPFSQVNNFSLLIYRAIPFINYLNLQRGTYGSPTVARPLQNILQTVHYTWLHIFHEDGVFRTLLHSYISNIQDQSFHQYKVLKKKTDNSNAMSP